MLDLILNPRVLCRPGSPVSRLYNKSAPALLPGLTPPPKSYALCVMISCFWLGVDGFVEDEPDSGLATDCG